MTNWSSCDRSFLTEIEPVVEELSEIVLADQILLIGARCRDLLSWSLGCGTPRRSTNDTDVAVALQDWDQFARVQDRFALTGHTGHRFLIGGIPTDVVPFGGVEGPPGISRQPPGNETLNVHGFSDVYERADVLPLSAGVHIRIPRPEGYAILKSHAWLDRSMRNEYRDGPDFALAVYWYSEDLDRLYAQENLWAIDLHNFDLRLAAAALLGRDMRNGLSSAEQAVLVTRFDGVDRDLLASNFGAGAPGWPSEPRDRRLIVDALLDQFASGHVQQA
jgi:predicted nucleotidyltransferase